MRVLILALLLTGCANTQVTALVGSRYENHDVQSHEMTLTLMVLYYFGDRTVCGYSHQSEILAGEPFHPERAEVTADTLSCGVVWGRGRRF